MCKISVITVCFNAETTIENTILSVLNQSYTNFEYIIIDGKSTDNTMDIIFKYKKRVSDSRINMVVISEKDNGIYNAMNKSIPLTKGEWLLFLNADDYFCDSDVLTHIAPELDLNLYDVVYGDTIFNKSNSMYKYDESKPINEIMEHMICSHQSIFTSKRVLSKFLFDEKYEIVADYNLFIKLYLLDYKFKKINFPISVFSIGGISTNKSYYKRKELEITDIHYCNGIINEDERDQRIKRIKKDNLLLNLKNKIKTITPKIILQKRKQCYYQEDGWSTQFPLY